MSWTGNKQELKEFIRERFWWTILMPPILMTKDNWFWGVVGATFGRLVGREAFMIRFATTLGPVVALPKEYSLKTAKRVCAHEIGGHLCQFWACGLFFPFIGACVGILLMTVLYGLLLPVGFNWFRYRLELHADVQMWKYLLDIGEAAVEIINRAKRFAKIVGSKAYGWPVWESWALWGFKRKAKKVVNK